MVGCSTRFGILIAIDGRMLMVGLPHLASKRGP